MTAAARAHRLRRHRTLLPYAAALAALLTVTACSGGDPGPTATTPPVSPTSMSTTTSAPPAITSATTTSSLDPVIAKIPTAARPDTEAGAAEFAKYYFGQINNGFQTGDPRAVEGLSVASCVTCQAFASAIKALKVKGQRYGADLAQVEYSSTLDFTPNVRVLIDLSQQQVPILDTKGKRVGLTPTGKASFVVSLKFSAHWTVTRIQKAKD
ncbi:DUF6318 family protein [Terrabacter sp. MAHUQ-38]|uniref:DUF6318 family protein n=1 Tax=unclassified Terrabacter TaxID=2630222 RepID=UPI001CAA7DDB|nr:DUF6318 family protein [Terrabacter sp. MAHUQ-38]